MLLEQSSRHSNISVLLSCSTTLACPWDTGVTSLASVELLTGSRAGSEAGGGGQWLLSGLQGGMMPAGFCPAGCQAWHPGRSSRPQEEQLHTGVMINFSTRHKDKVTPISVQSKCMGAHAKRKSEGFSRRQLKTLCWCLLQNSFRLFPG